MMKSRSSVIGALVLLALSVGLAYAGNTPPPAKTSAAGVKYVVGGVGADERKAMRTAYKHFKLRVEVAEKGGAYSADMSLKIRNSQGAELLDVLIDGPWLLVDIPAGDYLLEVGKDGGSHSQKITLGNEVQQHVLFIWPPPQ